MESTNNQIITKYQDPLDEEVKIEFSLDNETQDSNLETTSKKLSGCVTFCRDVVSSWWSHLWQKKEESILEVKHEIIEIPITGNSSDSIKETSKKNCIHSSAEKVVNFMLAGPEYKLPRRIWRLLYIGGSHAAGLTVMFFFPKDIILNILFMGFMSASIKGEDKALQKEESKIYKLEKKNEKYDPKKMSRCEKVVHNVKTCWIRYGLYSFMGLTTLAGFLIQELVLKKQPSDSPLVNVALGSTFLTILWKSFELQIKNWQKGKAGDDEDDDSDKEGGKDIKKLGKKFKKLEARMEEYETFMQQRKTNDTTEKQDSIVEGISEEKEKKE